MSVSLEKLNPEQRAVVVARGHCLAIACPGSGKTSTAATKAAYRLDQGERVGAVTFTKEAAVELRERIVKIAGPECSSRLLVGTFHSVNLLMAFPRPFKGQFGRAILSDQTTPYEKKWDLVNAGVQIGYVNRAIRDAGLKLKTQEAIAIIEAAKAADDTGFLDPAVQDLVNIYGDLLTQSGKIDFQDMLLLTNKALREKTMSPLHVDSLIVDEYQDTDSIQFEWIEHHARAGSSITAVGDDDQSIYAFRRALGVEGMERFTRIFGAERILLGTNYRCHSEILGAAEKLIGRNTERIAKRLHAAKGEGGTVMWESFASSAAEANAVAEEAALALEDTATFAVIARTNRELIDIQKAMVLRNLPYRKSDGKSLFDCLEVQTYAALLRSVLKPQPNDVDQVLAWAGMSTTDTQEVRKLFGSVIRSGSLSDFSNTRITEAGRNIWRSFAKKHGEWVSLNDKGAYTLLNVGVHEWLLETLQKPASDQVLAIASELFSPKERTLQEHLAYMRNAELRIKQEESGNGDKAHPPENVVWLLTAHSAKGLEFDRCWVIGVQHGQFPSDKSSLEEERRLMFVAMTRAREVLWVSATKEKAPSVFVYESGLLEPLKRGP